MKDIVAVIAKMMAQAGITAEDIRKAEGIAPEPVRVRSWQEGFDERFDAVYPPAWNFRKLETAENEQAFADAKEWLSVFQQAYAAGGRRLPNALITGDFGTGKTCLAGAMMRECQRAGACASLVTLYALLSGFWSKVPEEKAEARYEALERRRMLVIDEAVGSACGMAPAQEQELGMLLRARAAKGLSTVLVTNCPASMLEAACSAFLYSSILEMRPKVITLTGACRRRPLADIGDSWK